MKLNFQALEKDIQNRQIAPVYFFKGKERYLINFYIDKIKETVMTPPLESLNFKRFDQKKADITEILALSETVPFMAEKRIIVIDQDVGLTKSTNEEIINRLSEYLDKPSDMTVLIIIDSKPDNRLKINKELNKKARVIDFSKLNQVELRSWIKKLFNQEKVKISDRDITYLMDKLHYKDREEASIQGVKSACQNLIDYAGKEGSIDRKTIDEVIPESIEDNIFKIVESVVTGKLEGMAEILRTFWEQGESPIALFGLLIYQLRNMLKVKILLEKGYRQNEIAEITDLSAFVVRKTAALARHYSLNRLYQIMCEAAEMDLNMKRGTIDSQFGFEVFVLKLHKK